MEAAQTRSMTIGQIATLCEASPVPALPKDRLISAVSTMDEADGQAITWMVSSKMQDRLSGCRAGAILGKSELVGAHPCGLIVEDPESAIATLLEHFCDPPYGPPVGIHPTAIIDATAMIAPTAGVGAHVVVGPRTCIGESTIIFPGVSVGREVTIGRDSVIRDRCVIYDRSVIGDRVTLHAGVVIGSDGFGYIFRKGRHRKLMHLGNVVIEDDVEIGSNSCVDRGKFGPTRIGRGCKIDNLVQIAHNVQLGPFSIIVAQVGIAGSAKLGTGVVMGGQSGIREGISVGDGVQIGAQAGVMSSVEAGVTVLGSPAKSYRQALREFSAIGEVPQLLKRVALLEERVKKLDGSTDD